MKEKQFVYVKKDVKERDKEVIAKSVVFSLLFFSFIGIVYLLNGFMEVELIRSYFVRGLMGFIFVSGVCLVFYLLSEIFTRKYKLKELKK